MTNAQKLAIRLSEIRQRLNEIAGLEGDALTDEVRAETDTLTAEYQAKETQHRAALVVEAEEQRAAEGQHGNGDGEPAEVRALLSRVSLTDYLTPARSGIGLTGAPAELNAALEVRALPKYSTGGICIPWRMLECPEHRVAPVVRRDAEGRAFTTTAALDGGTMQRSILQRLFGPDIMGALGVRMDTVPVGMSEWPLLTGGVAPDMKPEGTAADEAVAASFTTETLKPKRLTGRYSWTHEQAAQVADIEQALRRDLADAVRSKMSDLILNGDESTDAHEPDGFLTKLAAPTAPTDVATYSDYAGSHAGGVDGIHASMETEVSSVIGTTTYQHAATVYQAGSGESGSEALRRRSMGCRASSYIPAAVTTGTGNNAVTVQDGNIFHSSGPNGGGASLRGDSIAAMWPVMEVVRDIYSQASQGVVLTWVTLWDAETAFRAAAYRRVAFRTA